MFFRKHTVKNKNGEPRTYLQLAESRRINGKSRPVVLLNLGRVGTQKGKESIDKYISAFSKFCGQYRSFDLEKDFENQWSKDLGLKLIYGRLWRELGFKDVLGNLFSDSETHFELSDAVFNMTLNRLDEARSKRGLLSWQNKIYDLNSYHLHQYYRAMDQIIENKDDIEKRLFDRMRNLFNQSVDIVLFDTTTLVYYGDNKEGDGLLQQGFSKAKRFDLKQIVVGVIMSKDGIPLGHEVFSGNKNDVTCFKEIIEKISNKFSIGKVILVGDRGMISQKNIQLLEEKGFDYILGYRMRTIKKVDRSKVLSKAGLQQIRKKDLHWKEVVHEGKRLVVCYNPERAVLDAEKRERTIEKLRKKLKGAKLKSLIGNLDYKKFLKIKGEKPSIDEEKVKQDELYDGVYVLTSNTKMLPGEIIQSYKDLWQIEFGFRQLKSEIKAGPIFHWKDDRIRAHIMICFYALVLKIVLRKKLKESEYETTFSDMISSLKNLKVSGIKLVENEIIARTNLEGQAKVAFDLLKMRVPNRILSSKPIKNLLVL